MTEITFSFELDPIKARRMTRDEYRVARSYMRWCARVIRQNRQPGHDYAKVMLL